jgi:glutamate formiminotransferase / formiminotetrahydrofolate cyclodeaminase
MKQIIECVPNFSEGRDLSVIEKITNEIKSVEGVKLLDVDPGAATNRTVVTFVGTPAEVVEAAFRAVKKASELIDMRKHKGEHPRMGATDVCPLVPVANITMEEVVEHARALAKRIGEELDIPVFCYENAALKPERRNLANCRKGEYEGLAEKFTNSEWKPDFGPAKFQPNWGATAVGARDFLVAYNINLNTTSTRRANAVAFDVRERGRVQRQGNPLTGKIVKDEKGDPVYVPGSLKEVKAIGWFIEEYGVAQLSMNLTNIQVTPIHIAFDEVCKKAAERGMRVTGSELVGLVPLKAMLDAGKYFLSKQQRSLGVPDAELIKIAVKSMGLDELKPFRPEEKIIEYMIGGGEEKRLIGMSVEAFSDETSSESPAPGGGSVSATVGALGVSLATMVANLSSHKRGWDEHWETFSKWAEKGQEIKKELLFLVDEDTRAFNRIMEAFGMSKNTEEERKARHQAIQEATRYAIEIPFQVMQNAWASMEVIQAMVEKGNPNSVTDAGVGALCARSAVIGAYLNVKINSVDLEDKTYVNRVLKEGAEIEAAARKKEEEILEILKTKLST